MLRSDSPSLPVPPVDLRLSHLRHLPLLAFVCGRLRRPEIHPKSPGSGRLCGSRNRGIRGLGFRRHGLFQGARIRRRKRHESIDYSRREHASRLKKASATPVFRVPWPPPRTAFSADPATVVRPRSDNHHSSPLSGPTRIPFEPSAWASARPARTTSWIRVQTSRLWFQEYSFTWGTPVSALRDFDSYAGTYQLLDADYVNGYSVLGRRKDDPYMGFATSIPPRPISWLQNRYSTMLPHPSPSRPAPSPFRRAGLG